MRTYKTEDRAYRRVAAIVRYYGCWPGVVRDDDGRYRLIYDPDDE